MIDKLRLVMGGPREGEHVRAVWNGEVLAESDRTIVVEGNHYFPPEDVDRRFLRPSAKRSVCPWKGAASYYTAEVGGRSNADAAWYYPNPLPAAKRIRGYVAFWHGVKVIPVEEEERAA